MGDTTTVVVPWAPTHERADRSWLWLRDRWERLHPDVELVVTDPETGYPGDAVNAAIAASADGVVAVVDPTVLLAQRWVVDATAAAAARRCFVAPRTVGVVGRFDSSDMLCGLPTVDPPTPYTRTVLMTRRSGWAGVCVAPRDVWRNYPWDIGYRTAAAAGAEHLAAVDAVGKLYRFGSSIQMWPASFRLADSDEG